MAHAFEDIQSYEDLENRLQQWGSFQDQYMYDFCGMINLLGACLDNLQQNAPEDQFYEVGNYLSEERRLFLIKLSQYVTAKL